MAASISGARACYPSTAVARRGGGRRCAVVRSSLATSSPAKCKPLAMQIGKQWTELQGARDWDGLLNPLDSALRGELVRYGEFVRAAYASFDFDGGVTWLLHASSTSAPSWLSCSSSYIGYVAVCDDEDVIEQLGRRDVVIALRGTATCSEWVDNFKSTLTHLPPRSRDDAGDGDAPPIVESGFWGLFTTPGKAHSSLQQQVRGEVQRIISEYGGKGMPPLSITVTGHSLSAALAVLTAYDITTTSPMQRHGDDGDDAPPMVTAVSFGGPRVGNGGESGGKVLRVVNSNDIVTKLPGFPVDDDCGGAREDAPARRKPRLPRWLVSKMGWEYSDVGRELRLCSQGDTARNVVASHDLDLYLKIVAACTN
uniref:Fungal lipase-type domain-containing protein n=1 Tax=Oryza punctata TaxID=4537 RepID=A0A0E0MJJ4_ORYPU